MPDQILRGGKAIAQYIACTDQHVFYLVRKELLPIWREGDKIVSTTLLLDEWLETRKREARAVYRGERQLESA